MILCIYEFCQPGPYVKKIKHMQLKFKILIMKSEAWIELTLYWMIQVFDLTNPYSTCKYCSLLNHWKEIQSEFQQVSITHRISI